MQSWFDKKFVGKVVVAFFVFCLAFAVPSTVFAGKLTFSPNGGTVKVGEKFMVDMMVDSEGSSLLEATAVMTFDPRYLKLVEAKRNTQLFATFPVGEQTTDNDNGVVMLTGFTQSGGNLYKTVGSPDVLARLTFEALKTGTVTLDWEFNGNNEAFKSVLMEDASPARNVLATKPPSVSFVITEAGDGTGGKTPDTGLFDNTSITVGASLLVAGIMMAVGSVLVYRGKFPMFISSDGRTIVRYDK